MLQLKEHRLSFETSSDETQLKLGQPFQFWIQSSQYPQDTRAFYTLR